MIFLSWSGSFSRTFAKPSLPPPPLHVGACERHLQPDPYAARPVGHRACVPNDNVTFTGTNDGRVLMWRAPGDCFAAQLLHEPDAMIRVSVMIY